MTESQPQAARTPAVLDGWGVLGDHRLRRADRVALRAASPGSADVGASQEGAIPAATCSSHGLAYGIVDEHARRHCGTLVTFGGIVAAVWSVRRGRAELRVNLATAIIGDQMRYPSLRLGVTNDSPANAQVGRVAIEETRGRQLRTTFRDGPRCPTTLNANGGNATWMFDLRQVEEEARTGWLGQRVEQRRGYSSRRTSIPDEPDGHGRGRKDGTSQGCLERTSCAVVVKRDAPGSAVAWRVPCDGGKPPGGDV